jgi:hypothetical protein
MSISIDTPSKWGVALLRATLFDDKSLTMTTDQIWSALEIEPERREERPKEGLKREGAIWSERTFDVMRRSDRIDLILSATSTNDPSPDVIDQAPPELLSDLRSLFPIVAGQAKSCRRVAIASTVLFAAAGDDDGRKAMEVVSGHHISGELSDFVLQRNERRVSRVGKEFLLNRVVRISGGASLAVNIGVAGKDASAPSEVVSRPVVRFDVDVNNAPLPGRLLTVDEITSLLDEIGNEVLSLTKSVVS